ncbi:regulator of nonsense transcripts 1 [Nematocida sp. LUAm3]|nr:regulator of nonsense transcripts 1 [Nematocida sp. LUAm3]KAI5176121.1 regulator of nonsense transcripts 1 [Nematocida sp. LUAm2]KAI5179009.1 regulator of nonsense transcripts 1 [Nematocida sp. LUAm1]
MKRHEREKEEDEVYRKRRKEEEMVIVREIGEDAVETFRVAGTEYWREILKNEALLGSIREFIKRNKTIRVSDPCMLLPLPFLLVNEEELKEWSIRAVSDLPKEFAPLSNEEEFFYELQVSIYRGESEVKEGGFFKALLIYLCLGGVIKEEHIELLRKRFLEENEISVKYFLFKILLARFFSLSGEVLEYKREDILCIREALSDLLRDIPGHLMRTRNKVEGKSIYPLLTPWEILKKTFILPISIAEKIEIIKCGIKSKTVGIIRDGVKEIFLMYKEEEISGFSLVSSSFLDPIIWYGEKAFIRDIIKETEKILLREKESFPGVCASWRTRISSLEEEEALMFIYLLFFLPMKENERKDESLSLLLSEIRRRIEKIPLSNIPCKYTSAYLSIPWFQGKKENKDTFSFSSLISLCQMVSELFKSTKKSPNNIEGLCSVIELAIKREEKKERIRLLKEIVKFPFLDPILSQVNFLLISLSNLTEEEALSMDLSWMHTLDLRASQKPSLKSTLLINITEKYLEILNLTKNHDINIIPALERISEEASVNHVPSLIRAIDRVKKSHEKSKVSTKVEVQRVRAIPIEPSELVNRSQKKKEKEYLISSFYDSVLSGTPPNLPKINHFSSYDEYFEIFSSLIIQEALCSLEEEDKEEIHGVVIGIQRSSSLSEIKVEVKTRNPFNNNDFILISKEQDKEFCARGVVIIDNSLRKNEILIKTKEDSLFKHILRIRIRVSTCLTTHAREYNSLISLQKSLFFLKYFLFPSKNRNISLKNTPIKNSNLKFLQEIRDNETNKLNDSQKSAIKNSLKRTVSLIQGPPGTGKTRTISILVIEALLLGKKVLVTAPSNSAVSWAMDSILSLIKRTKEVKWIRIGNSSSISSFSSQNLIFSTLSSSGSKFLKDTTVDVVIVDEACQATEPSTLIPLLLKPSQVILVGDDMQLPPTVISDSEKLKVSLFERIRDSYPPFLLNTQYRMHKSISHFPNTAFYNNQIINGAHSGDKPPLLFIETKGKEASEDLHGKINREEANQIILLIKRIHTQYKRIGVISPYKSQCSLILKSLTELNLLNVEVSTVDRFQGQEKECIILSTVRTDRIGFLNDYRRVNVAITRAKETLIILGSPSLLQKDATWRQLLAYLTEQQAKYTLKAAINLLLQRRN